MDLSAEEAMLYGQDVRLSNYILKIFQKKENLFWLKAQNAFMIRQVKK